MGFAATIPRQHGAWSVLLLGYALGTAVGGYPGWPAGLLLLSLLAALPARHTLALCLRLSPADPRRRYLWRWAAAYVLLTVLPAALLVLAYERWALLPLGALAGLAGVLLTQMERARQDRSLAGEVLGMVGLSLAVPAAAHVGSGLLSPALGGLWLLAALVFSGSVFHVRFLLRGQEAGHAGLVSLVFHVLALGLVVALTATSWVEGGAWLALVPAFLRAFWAVWHPRCPSVRRLGFEELAYGVAFAVLTALIWGGANSY